MESQVIRPILCEGQVIGAVMVVSKNPEQVLGDVEKKSAEIAAIFLGAQMEQ